MLVLITLCKSWLFDLLVCCMAGRMQHWRFDAFFGSGFAWEYTCLSALETGVGESTGVED